MDGNSSQGNIIGRSKESLAIRKALKNTDIFLPNSREARRLTGETDLESALRMLGVFCPLVVVKDGRNGCLAYTKDTLFHVPGIQVDSIDTTGAGDCFDAGFMVAYMNEMPLEDCMKWGNITGGLSTTEPGGTTKRINVQDVNNYFSRYYP